jgi:hypothetical protein
MKLRPCTQWFRILGCEKLWMTCVAVLCGVVGGVVSVHCRSRVGGVGDGWRMLGSDGGGGGMLGAGSGGLGGGWDNLVWMASAQSDVKMLLVMRGKRWSSSERCQTLHSWCNS